MWWISIKKLCTFKHVIAKKEAQHCATTVDDLGICFPGAHHVANCDGWPYTGCHLRAFKYNLLRGYYLW